MSCAPMAAGATRLPMMPTMLFTLLPPLLPVLFSMYFTKSALMRQDQSPSEDRHRGLALGIKWDRP